MSQPLIPLSSLRPRQAAEARLPAAGPPASPVAAGPRAPRRDFKAIELGAKEEFVLTALEVGLSSNCNFRCDYCCAYNLNDHKFMTADRVIAILDDLPRLQRVKLSGGEVLIYFDECLAVIEYCTARGLETQVNTNGSLLDAPRIARLEAAGLGCLHVSYNFTDRDPWCAYYKQPPKVFDRIEQTIRTTAASAIDTVVESVVFRKTEHTMVDLHRRVYELGVHKHEIQNGIPIQQRDWADVLPPRRVEAVIADLIQRRHPEVALYFSCIDIDPQGDFYPKVLDFLKLGGVHFPSCIEGRNQLHVHSNGDVLICELGHPTVIGNLKAGTRLSDLLTNKPPELIDFLERRSAGKCSCTIRTLVQPL